MISTAALLACALSLDIPSFGAVEAPEHFSPALYGDMRWRMIGPFRGGRTVAVAGIPDRPNVFYIGAVNGGVWKSTDYGQVWTPLFDAQPTGSVGAIAIAPSNPNIIYAGSGEGLRRPDLSVGDGIYKSTDGGLTWQHLGLRDGQQIGLILVDPKDENRVLVAVLGHPYGPNAQRGVFQSSDGGQTWQKVLYQDENTGAIDLAFDPDNSNRIYAVLWASRRPPWSTGNPLQGAGSGLYVSTDGGASWGRLGVGLPTAAQGLGRIGLGVAPGDAKRIYALVDAGEGGGLYRSDDAGHTWARVNAEERIWGRGSDFAGVTVAPDDADRVYVANTSTYRSDDGGHTFKAIKGAPGGDDYHTVWINPRNPSIIALASDQGATISVNGGATWSSWYNQPTAQFYHVATDNRFPYWVYGGQQESGSAGVASRSDYGEITFREWHPVGTEEYGYVAPDPLDPNIVYGGKVTRFNHQTGEVQDVSPVVLRTGKYRFNRTAPLVFSPTDPHVLYLGSNVVFRTSSGGRSWDIISPDLTRADPGVPSNMRPFGPRTPRRRGVVYTLAPSPKDRRLIWAGTDDGLVWLTADGAKSWRNVTPPQLTSWSKLAMIEASHFDSARAYAAVNRFRLDDLHPYVYRTRDRGRSWQAITRGLPDDAPVNVVREDPQRPGLLFAGTERAVYVSFDDGGRWQPLQLNLPATSMRDLAVHGDDLVVGTHGRSFWILDDITPLRQMDGRIAVSAAHLFRPQVALRLRRDQNTDTPLPPEVPAGRNPPDGAVIDYFLGSAAANPVTLTISDAAGRPIRVFSSADVPARPDEGLNVPTYWLRPPQSLSPGPGMHRFVWDLRYPPPDALEHNYPISAIYGDTPRAPLGRLVVPGRYSVALRTNGKTMTQPLTVRIDPRVRTSQAGLMAQADLAAQITGSLRADSALLGQVRALQGRLNGQGAEEPADPTGRRAFDEKLAALAEGPGQAGSLDDLTSINVALASLLEVVEGADSAPTSQARAAFATVRNRLAEASKRWNLLEAQRHG
ncbi:MAG: glycoside hydrolase [Candidatus Eremiobacteraeota bacterium]|nr:glycoside hydrolase [Candidatus Eremiobacteraeota bacterium]